MSAPYTLHFNDYFIYFHRYRPGGPKEARLKKVALLSKTKDGINYLAFCPTYHDVIPVLSKSSGQSASC